MISRCTNVPRDRRLPLFGLLLAAAGAARLPSQDPSPFGEDFGRGRLFSLPRSQDDIHEWRTAQKEIAQGRMETAVERLHALLNSGRGGVVPLDQAGERFLGLRTAVLTTLRELPADGQAAYDKLTQREARSLVRAALTSSATEPLRVLATDFPTSEAGRRARQRLGDLALEAGRADDAELHYRTLLDALPAAAPARTAIEQRLAIARQLRGEPTRPDEAAAVAAVVRAVRPPGCVPPAVGWPAYGGGGDGRRNMRAPLGTPAMHKVVDVRAFGFIDRPMAMHAVGDLSGIVVNDGQSLLCFDPIDDSTQPMWSLNGPMLEPDSEAVAYEHTINRDGALAAAVSDDVVVGALQVPNDGDNAWFRQFQVISRLPRRRLFACDRATGKLLWSHWDSLDGAVTRRFSGHDVAGPPLIRGDTVFVPAHDQTGAITYYLSAYDLRTGEPKWRQLVCSSQGEVNMFGYSRREYAASPLACSDGVVYGCTNLGVCFAADAATGQLRWVSAYEALQMPETSLTDQRDRPVFFANNPVVLADGVMACTPLDSAYALGLDCETGELQWRLHYQAMARKAHHVRWLLGTTNDEFVFTGLGVVAVPIRGTTTRGRLAVPRSVRSPDRLGVTTEMTYAPAELPRGAIADDTIYHTTATGLHVLSPQGDVDDRVRLSTETPLGNLLLVDGIAVSLRSGYLCFHYDLTRLLAEAESNTRAATDDPAALLRLASLVRATCRGKTSGPVVERAEQLFRQGLASARASGLGPDSQVYRKLANELADLGRRRALDLHGSAPDRALTLMRAARDDAVSAERWLDAQLHVLAWVAGDRAAYRAELALMAERHGDAQLLFPDMSVRVPVAAYVLLQMAQLATAPAQAIAFAQELIDRFPDVDWGNGLARDMATALQSEQITRHGRRNYDEIERRAQAAFEAAAGDEAQLRAVAQRYPLSLAAQRARRSELDSSVARGDLAATMRAFATAVAQRAADGNVCRRVIAAARNAGNPALAAALAERVVAAHGDETSDFAGDGGRKLREVFAGGIAVPTLAARRLAKPLAVIARRLSRDPTETLRLCRLRSADGFADPDYVPLLVATSADRLEVYDTTNPAPTLAEPRFAVAYAHQETEEPLACGDTLVLTEIERVRGVDLRNGTEKWSLTAEPERIFTSLGCMAGVLHVFSELRTPRDGVLLGIEPQTGVVLFRHAFGDEALCIPPVSSGAALWRFLPDDATGPAIVRLDPLTGAESGRTPLLPSVQKRLGLDTSERRRSFAPLLHRQLLADELGLYLPMTGDGDEPPHLAAIAYDGQERWPVWTGTRARMLTMCAAAGGRIVLVEQDASGGRLLLLNRVDGALRLERVLPDRFVIRNWSRTERAEPAPDVLVLDERNQNQGGSVTFFALAANLQSFQQLLPNRAEAIVPRPVMTSDFVAFAVRRETGYLDLLVLDPNTRQSLVPKGALRFPGTIPHKMITLGDSIAIQSAEGIYLLGEPKK